MKETVIAYKGTLKFTFILSSNAVDDVTWGQAYRKGIREPRFPVPVIPLQVVWPDDLNSFGYKDMIYIDDIGHRDDPVMVCAWDFYEGPNRIGELGKYTYVGRRGR